MQTYDSPRDYKTALGSRFGTRTAIRAAEDSATPGMSPVTLSARLMIAIAQGRAPLERQDVNHDDESPSPRVRIHLGQAAA